MAIASGIAIAIVASRVHRSEADAGRYLHNYAEQLAASYVSCGGSAPTLAQFVGFAAPTVNIMYWTGSGFTSSTCTTDPGLEQATITLKTSDLKVKQSLVVVVRKP